MAATHRKRRTDLEILAASGIGPRAPDLMLITGAKAFGRNTTCDDIHRGPIPSGSLCCCAVCHSCGVEHRTRDHTKPGDGQLREGWEVAQPTVYVPPAATTPRGGTRRLRGGTGR